jgi:hypothetical protein
MKKILITVFIISYIMAIKNVQSQPLMLTDHSFSYQGELIDNGSPATGTYDFTVQMVDDNGFDIGTASVHDDVDVSNGLFNLDVNIGGINYFTGAQNYFMEISVRAGASTGAFTVLTDVQAVQAVPLATNLTNGNATSGQVLTFNGLNWAPASPAISPWVVNGNSLEYVTASGQHISITNGGNVNSNSGLLSIGQPNSEHIAIDSDDIQGQDGSNNPSELSLNFYGGDVFLASPNQRTIVNGQTDASLEHTSGSFIIGNLIDLNLVMDGNEIMARNNGSHSPLLLQHTGGVVRINQNSSVSDASLDADGGALILGSSTLRNIVFDDNEIMARNNGASATLYLQADSGTDLDIGSSDGLVNIGGSGNINMSIDANDIQVRNNGTPASLFLNYDGGNVQVGSSSTSAATTGLKVYGQIFIDGSVIHTSDKRLKKDVEALPYGLAEIMVLEPKAYNWKNREQKYKSLGLIAQDVQKLMPEVVSVGEDKKHTLGLSYTELVPVLINAVKEQQTIISEQNKKIDNLMKKFEKLEKQMQAK